MGIVEGKLKLQMKEDEKEEENLVCSEHVSMWGASMWEARGKWRTQGFLMGEIKKEIGRSESYGDASSNGRPTGYCQWVGSIVLAKSWVIRMRYVTEFLNQTNVLQFLSESEVWVKSY